MRYLTEYLAIRKQQKDILAAQWTPSGWQKETAYPYNTLVKPTTDNGSYYRCIIAGNSGATEPVWPTTFWAEKTDGTIRWRQENPVFILDSEPVDFSYPCVIVGDIGIVSEIQMALGNVPANQLRTDVGILTYQKKGKTFQQNRMECFDVLRQVQNIVRSYPNLDNLPGILSATSGVYTIDNETLPVIYRVNLLWLSKTLSRGG